MNQLTEKLIQVNFTLASGSFGTSSGSNTKLVQGLRVELEYEKSGHPSKNKAKLKVYGMLQQDMMQLTTLAFNPLAVRNNLIQVLAGDEINGMTTVFQGEISNAYQVYQSPPNLYFHVEAVSGFYPSIASAQPTTYRGSADVATLMNSLAGTMGYAFENNGVSAKLSSPYLSGTAFEQASRIAEAANIEFGIDDQTLWIAPKNTARNMVSVPLISASSGMKEYPTFDKKGLRVTTLFNPGIVFGGLVKVQSVVPQASGTWRVVAIKTRLECLKPNGHWFQEIKGAYVGE